MSEIRLLTWVQGRFDEWAALYENGKLILQDEPGEVDHYLFDMLLESPVHIIKFIENVSYDLDGFPENLSDITIEENS